MAFRTVSVTNNCEPKPSDEVEGAALYDYSTKLGKFASTENGKAKEGRIFIVYDFEEYQQCQDMLDKASTSASFSQPCHLGNRPLIRQPPAGSAIRKCMTVWGYVITILLSAP